MELIKIDGLDCHLERYPSGLLSVAVKSINGRSPLDIALAVFRGLSKKYANESMQILVSTSKKGSGNRAKEALYEYQTRHGHLSKVTSSTHRKWYSLDGTTLTHAEFEQLSAQRIAEAEAQRIENERVQKLAREHAVAEWQQRAKEHINALDEDSLRSVILALTMRLKGEKEIQSFSRLVGIPHG